MFQFPLLGGEKMDGKNEKLEELFLIEEEIKKLCNEGGIENPEMREKIIVLHEKAKKMRCALFLNEYMPV